MEMKNTVSKTKNEIVITRYFHAPVEKVWEAWKNPEFMKNWWAPKECTTPHCKIDFRTGGRFHFCMRMNDGTEIWGLGIYLKIIKNELIEYDDSFADEKGNPVPPSYYGMSESHPESSRVTVRFTENNGVTELTLHHRINEGVAEREGMIQGWSEMLDRLESIVK